jgi:ABC-type transport system involved in cytochrome c biogenesis ATPase subunit
MITALSTSNFGCLQAIELGLTPFHALVGPNDAGKSTLLRALRTLAQFAAGAFSDDGALPFDPWLPEGADIELGLPWLRARTPRGSYYLTSVQRSLTESLDEVPGFSPTSAERPIGRASAYATDDHYAPVLRQIGPARVLRLDPDAMRRPAPILRDGRPVDFADERGTGLAAVLQAMNGRDVERFLALQEGVRRRFPGVRKVQLRFDDAASPNVLLHATLADGKNVDASRLSDGLLYFLALSALEFLDPTPILLVDSPESGLDPAGVRGAMALLRAFHQATQTQVVVATRSPLVVDEMAPEEVTVVTKPDHERGTLVTPLERTPDFAKRAASLKPGEIWLALAGEAGEKNPHAGGAP